MKIHVSQSGGFAGISMELARVDTAALPDAARQRLERLVREADFFERPAQLEADAATGIGADVDLRYDVTVEDAGRRHTVSFTDGGHATGGATAIAPLRALVSAGVGAR